MGRPKGPSLRIKEGLGRGQERGKGQGSRRRPSRSGLESSGDRTVSRPEEAAGRAARRRAPPGLGALWATPRTARPGRREPWGVRWDQRSQRRPAGASGIVGEGAGERGWAWAGRAWPGLACASVVGRGCVRVLVCRSTRCCPRPRPGWIRVWVDGLSGGCPTGRASERARSRATRPAGSCVCVLGPAAQHWSRLAPTGMRLLSAPPAAPCSTRRWPPGKRGGRGQKSA